MVKMTAYSFPQRLLASYFFSGSLKEWTAKLLNLIHEKRQYHQMHEDRTEVFLTQSVIVAEIIALIFKGVEGLIFDSPSRATTTHDLCNIVQGDFKVRHPTEALEDNRLLTHHLPVFKKIDLEIVLAGFIKWYGVDKSKTMRFVRIRHTSSVTSPFAASSTWSNRKA